MLPFGPTEGVNKKFCKDSLGDTDVITNKEQIISFRKYIFTMYSLAW